MTPVVPLAGLMWSWCDFGTKIHLGHCKSDLQCCCLVSTLIGLSLSVKEDLKETLDDSERRRH